MLVRHLSGHFAPPIQHHDRLQAWRGRADYRVRQRAWAGSY